MRSVATLTGSNFRNRLYWRWQAWRLRKVQAQEASRSVSLFANLAALNHRGHADLLCELARSLCARSTGLAASSPLQVRERLARELGQRSRVAVLGGSGGGVGGYAWARVTTCTDAIDNFRQTPSLCRLGDQDWAELSALLGDKAALVIYDLGLDTHYRRGFSPLKQLLKPLFELGLSYAATRALWWAPRDSAAYDLSVAFGARCIAGNGDVAFFVHDDIASLAQVFAALPAGEISRLLARVNPVRTARAPSARPTAVALQEARLGTIADVAGSTLAVADQLASNDAALDEFAAADRTAAASAARVPPVASANLPAAARPAAAAPAERRPSVETPILHALPERLSALFPRLTG